MIGIDIALRDRDDQPRGGCFSDRRLRERVGPHRLDRQQVTDRGFGGEMHVRKADPVGQHKRMPSRRR